MKTATVRRYFADAETGEHYDVGDTFKGTPEKINDLRANGLLEREDGASQDQPDPLEPYRRSGGMYEFPSPVEGGEPIRVRGKEAAQAELNNRTG